MRGDMEQQSFKGLLSLLMTEMTELFRQELKLANAELRQNLSRASSGLVTVAAGSLVAFAALLVLLQALIVALANFVEPSIAALLVGGTTAVIAFALVQKGLSSLTAEKLMPRRTARSLRKDTELAKGHTP